MRPVCSIYLIIFICFCRVDCLSCVQGPDGLSTDFPSFVRSVLNDSTNRWTEYPKPPSPTADLLMELEKELSDDTALRFFKKLSVANFQFALEADSAIAYFEQKGKTYSILAMTVHWSPDVRITALKSLNKRMKMRPLVCTTKDGALKLKVEDMKIYSFLLYVLEKNPLFISGSENATIHGVYISNILWNLDLYSGMNLVGEKMLRDWYKSDSHFNADFEKWKNHLEAK